MEATRHALIEGEESGVPEAFNFKGFKRRKIRRHGRLPAQSKEQHDPDRIFDDTVEK